MDYILAHQSRLLIDFRDRLILSTSSAQAYLGAEVERVPVASDLCILLLNDLPSTHSQIDLRARLALLDQVDYQRISRAQQLLSWRAQHRFCGVCAQSLQLDTDDLSLFCTQCSTRLFPRISPCIIVLIENSLMLGYFAQYAGGEIVPDGIEIKEARWFTLDDLETVILPPEFSISRQLINHWVLRQRQI